jgi:multisubunit Na+/H+ antiporter MnhB subunit
MTASLGAVRPFAAEHGTHQRDIPFREEGEADRATIIAAFCECGTTVIGFALFIIGCMAAGGYFTGVVAGGCAIGLSIPLLLMYLVKGVVAKTPQERSQAVINAILMFAITVIGSLGIAGVLPAVTVGWIVVAPTLISLVVSYCSCCCSGLAMCALFGFWRLTNNN